MTTVTTDPHVAYLLRHADDNLVLAQSLGGWIAHAPDLEDDIALGNIALDHLGQARTLLAHAGDLEAQGRGEDDLAMFRTERQFTNLILVEQPNGDYADTMARALLFDAYQVELWAGLSGSADPMLAGIAAKAAKEAAYHLLHSSTWVVRLGDGTAESHGRMQRAIDRLWRFSAEMFETDAVTEQMTRQRIGIDPASLRPGWEQAVESVLSRATLDRPPDVSLRTHGRQGIHTEHLGHLLAEMQWLQRSYPGLSW